MSHGQEGSGLFLSAAVRKSRGAGDEDTEAGCSSYARAETSSYIAPVFRVCTFLLTCDLIGQLEGQRFRRVLQSDEQRTHANVAKSMARSEHPLGGSATSQGLASSHLELDLFTSIDFGSTATQNGTLLASKIRPCLELESATLL